MVRINAVGDVSLSRRIGENDYFTRKDSGFRRVQEALNDCQILIANFEFPFTEDRHPGLMESRPELCNLPEYREVLAGVRWTVFSTANNHCLDWGLEGIRTTREILSKHARAVVGSGADLADAGRPEFVEHSDVKFGFLSYGKRGRFSAKRNAPGANPLDMRTACADVRRILSLGADIVVVSLHWGVEFSSYPHPDDVSLARRLIDEGAALIIGHHPHTLQGVERHHHGLIAYSLGNFIADMKLDRPPAQDAWVKGHWGGILQVDFERREIVAHRFIPTVINGNMETTLANEAQRAEILEHLEVISLEIGTQKFYESAFSNIFLREFNAWMRQFRDHGLRAIPLFLRTIKLRHFQMLYGHLASKLKRRR